MKGILLTCLIGVIAGAIDVLPMIKMKLDRFSIVSAFVFYFILPFIILNTELFGMPWWLKGGVIGFALALPVIIIVAVSYTHLYNTFIQQKVDNKDRQQENGYG